MKKYIYPLFLSLLSAGIFAQSYTDQIQIESQFAKKQKEITLNMEFSLDKLDLHSKHLLFLTPVLESADGTQTMEFSPIVVAGKNRAKVISRMEALGQKDIFAEEPYIKTKRYKGQPQKISYTQTAGFESWMRKGRLILREEVAGCTNCGVSESQKEFMSSLLGDPYKPVYTTSYVTPPVEEIKNRDEVRELRLTFKVNSTVLTPDLEQNRIELEKVDSIIRAITSDEDLTLTILKITGYASPEGGSQVNMRLSEGRAKALADYIAATHKVDKNRFNLNWKGEDWDGLVEAVKSSEMTDKEKEDVIDIILNTDAETARKSKLQSYNGGRTYRWMLTELYPSLRRNNCVIDFTVRQFDLEKARKMIRTNPKLMSLNEMYIVAASYPAGSPENQEAFDIAVRMYPDSPAAANNSAAALIEKGDFSTALDKLERINEHPESWINFGISLAETGRYEEAASYFQKAINAGSPEAWKNLDELNKLLEDL